MTAWSFCLFLSVAVGVLNGVANGFTVGPHQRVARDRVADHTLVNHVAPKLLPRRGETHLHGFLRNIFSKKDDDTKENEEGVPLFLEEPPAIPTTKKRSKKKVKATETASLCIVGGGCSGLAAAITASKAMEADDKIVVLEASDSFGGRVQSDETDDGFVLDRGFAVFIEEYPVSKELLDYDELKLHKFLPGALVKIKDSSTLARVADPLRQPGDIFEALSAPVGSLLDKLSIIPLIFWVRTKEVSELFQQPETDTLTRLKDRWGIGDDMLEKFFMPFLEGIYLAPLEEQSSRMFEFVFKMFSEGSATLPEGGMKAVTEQLVERANATNVDLRVGQIVTKIMQNDDGYLVETLDGKTRIQAKDVIIATDGSVAQKLISQIEGFEELELVPGQPQREVGCLYYSFDTEVPVKDPILILNGIGEERGNQDNPANTICFPSVVAKGYAPDGYGLCSVTVLEDTMKAYRGNEDELDTAVRMQLSTWFPAQCDDILNRWSLRAIYDIPNAQPGQLSGPWPANVNGGRPCTRYREKNLPDGLLVCGDHMATATLNGAFESGVNAGNVAANALT